MAKEVTGTSGALKSRLPGSWPGPLLDPASLCPGPDQAAPAMPGAGRWEGPWTGRPSTGRGPQVREPGGAPGRNPGLPWWLVLLEYGTWPTATCQIQLATARSKRFPLTRDTQNFNGDIYMIMVFRSKVNMHKNSNVQSIIRFRDQNLNNFQLRKVLLALRAIATLPKQ